MQPIPVPEPRLHSIRTPEGIVIDFEVAPLGARLRALLIDLAIVFLATAGLQVVATPLALGWLGLLAGFLLQNLYFLYCEASLGGRTVGKSLARLRVLSRNGGPLTPDAVLARNVTRSFELFLPLVALFAPQTLIPGAPKWAAVLAFVWIFAFTSLPLFNRDRLRCGDLAAGTLVVREPEDRATLYN